MCGGVSSFEFWFSILADGVSSFEFCVSILSAGVCGVARKRLDEIQKAAMSMLANTNPMATSKPKLPDAAKIPGDASKPSECNEVDMGTGSSDCAGAALFETVCRVGS